MDIFQTNSQKIKYIKWQHYLYVQNQIFQPLMNVKKQSNVPGVEQGRTDPDYMEGTGTKYCH